MIIACRAESCRVGLQLCVSLRYWQSPFCAPVWWTTVDPTSITADWAILCRCKTCIKSVWTLTLEILLLSPFFVFHWSPQRCYSPQNPPKTVISSIFWCATPQLPGWSTRLPQWLATGQHLVLCCDGRLRSLEKYMETILKCAGNPWFFTTKRSFTALALGCSVRLLC